MDRDTLPDANTPHEMIDACRPGSQDIHDAEMQPLAEAIAQEENLGRAYQATQRADAKIGKAFQSISPPDGLATRIIASLNEAEVEAAEAKPEVLAPNWWTRRKLLVAVGGTIAASVAVAIMYVQSDSETDFSDDDARNAIVKRWMSDLGTDGWTIGTMPEDFPPPRYVSYPPNGWKLVDGGTVVCYELSQRANDRVLLFVTPGPTGALPLSPQIPNPHPYAKGALSTAWASNGWVYVLAVDAADSGDQLLLQKVLNTRHA